MNENEQQNQNDDVQQDPKENTTPPSNPDTSQEDVERGEEQIEKISGN
jgi:hypothetical protein